MSQVLTIPYPDTLPDDLNLSRQEFEGEARLALAAKWYEMGRLSSAQAAQMAGLDRVRFLLALQKLGVSFFNLDEDELNRELALARETFAGRQ
jgi:predicted HTH domain antitoxin